MTPPLPTVREVLHRGLLKLAAAFLRRAVQDLGGVKNYVAYAERCLSLQRICERRPGGHPPTPDEVTAWLAEVDALYAILRGHASLTIDERRFARLLTRIKALDWRDITIWQTTAPRCPRGDDF